jgi:hypothetical protein
VTRGQAAGESDAGLAAILDRVELDEELTAGAMGRLIGHLPGPLSIEQIYALEARSAMLAPPSADLPVVAAPDEAAQRAMVAKARDWSKDVYAHLPALTSKSLIARFEDGHAGATAGMSGSRSGQPSAAESGLDVRLVNKHLDTARFAHGVEDATLFSETTEPGENGVVAAVNAVLTPEQIFKEAGKAGEFHFLRWQTVNGVRLAVFSIEVDKKRSHYGMAYRYLSTETKFTGGEKSTNAGGGTNSSSSFEVTRVWKRFEHRSGYSSEVFVEPGSGMVLRTVTKVEFNPNDILSSETVRTDYAPLPVDSGTLVVPVRRFKITEFVERDAKTGGKATKRHRFVTEDFKDFERPNEVKAVP